MFETEQMKQRRPANNRSFEVLHPRAVPLDEIAFIVLGLPDWWDLVEGGFIALPITFCL